MSARTRPRRTAATRAAWAVAAAVVLAGCSSSSDAPDPAAVTTTVTTTPGVSPEASPSAGDPTGVSTGAGDTAAGDTAEPTDVATDPPLTTGGPRSDDLEVVVSYAGVAPDGGSVEVAGFVPGVVEDGGRCKLVLARSRKDDVSVDGEAFADAQSTSCALLSVPVGRLAPGDWTARLEYRSGRSSGTSSPMTIAVP
ncbi:hypothetical protein [Geodermatophilus sp. URMC 62]|uniref:hypothetical protein n=1 Tax=Geodermatophilus sp. URMC 62 TaxID=3423414 RepID=UPI00406D36E3